MKQPRTDRKELVLMGRYGDERDIGAISAASITNCGRPVDYPDDIASELSCALGDFAAECIFDAFADRIIDWFWGQDSLSTTQVFVVWYNLSKSEPYVDVVAMMPVTDEMLTVLLQVATGTLNDVYGAKEDGIWQ